MKTIADKSGTLQISVEVGGVEKILTSKRITKGLLKELDAINKSDKDNIPKLEDQICLLFGGKPEDTDEFTIFQLQDIMGAVLEFIKNPTA